jgi:endonuclease-3
MPTSPGRKKAERAPKGKSRKPPHTQTALEDPDALRSRTGKIAELLGREYPDARCMLDHGNPFELLIATILAAQCTDERVNSVTPALFRRYPDPAAMAGADIGELEELVRSTGFFHSKAKSIRGASEALASKNPGGFPRTIEELVVIPGVGRKTANVVLGTCFGLPAIIVDTHFHRVARRLGLTRAEVPDAIEAELQRLLPPEKWTRFSHGVTFHGRRRCKAKKPDCPACSLSSLCPWPDKTA